MKVSVAMSVRAETDAIRGQLLHYIPLFILSVSLVQVIIFIVGKPELFQLLLFSYKHLKDVWRYLSYMLLHTDAIHLVLNITIQCLVASLLEYEQGSLRTGMVYISGGLAGSIGTSILDPELSMVGASAGVYAVLLSHISHLVLNWKHLSYKSYRLISVCSLCTGDVLYNVLHPNLPLISWSAHLSGAIVGLLAGFVFYSRHSEKRHFIALEKFYWC
uniref:Peptidase S54 rhomboid domain-containing protein n=1 Tax=Clastoptera arizonana TaxID=38151 RepID=A0A1B6D2G6_9HEMI